MSRIVIYISALFGFAPAVQAQSQNDALPPGAIARLGEVRYRGVGRVFSIAFAPDGRTLLAGAWDGSIRLWDVATGKEIRQYTGHRGWVRSVAFSPDGKIFASGGKDKIIRVWETTTGKVLQRLEGNPYPVERVIFLPDGKTLASRSMGPTLSLWDVSTGTELRRIDLDHLKRFAHSPAFSPNGKLLAYIHDRHTIALLDLATGKEVRRISDTLNWNSKLVFSPDSKVLTCLRVANVQSYTTHFWDIATGKELRALENLESDIGELVFAEDGRSMAKAGGDHSIRVWEVLTRRERCRFASPDKKPSSLAFSPNGRILAQGSEDITMLLWDLTGLVEKGRPRPVKLSDKDLQAVWDDLAHADAALAYRAIWKLAAGSTGSVSFFREKLRPVAPADAHTISRFVADLDSERFETRQHATEELEKLAELAEPALRRALEEKPPLEKRQRIDRLLEKVGVQRATPSPERLRMLRALETLELMDAPAAWQVLEEYAKGASAADLTKEANAALTRLAKRSIQKP